MKKNIQEQIEETLNSFDGMQRAEAAAFFQTRLQAKMEKQIVTDNVWLPVRKPVWVIATLTLFFAINTVLIVEQKKQSTAQGSAETSSLQSFASEYGLNSTSNY